MSDDEYVAGGYSPYSDLEDLLWDADPAPDLADDLASHALHSPIFADEPGYELLDYHSDWEYYSDDYFDDDPHILKNNPQDGGSSKVRRPGGDQTARGKKRKLVETQDIPPLDLGERKYLEACMKGTIWATPIPERENLYTSTEPQKVALMKDWKNKFGSVKVQPENGSKEVISHADESWAANMSLADMGLTNERGVRMEPGGGQEATEEDEEEPNEAEDGEDEMQGVDIETLKQLAESLEPGAEIDVEKLMKEANVVLAARRNKPQVKREAEPPTGDELSPRPEKRRKTHETTLPSPPASNKSVLPEPIQTAAQPEQEVDGLGPTQPRSGRGRPRKQSKPMQARSKQESVTRKRKASTSPEPAESPPLKASMKTTASSRAKRVATGSKKAPVEDKGAPPIATAASSRPSRTRKK